MDMDLIKRLGNWSASSEDILCKHFPVHRACRDGDIEQLSSLLSNSEPNLYEEDGLNGWTPIHWAAYFGKLSCLMSLLERGTSCDAATHRLTQTPCHLAATGGYSQCLKWLLHCGAMINRQDYLGETPIHKAAGTGNMECVSLLVSQGAKLSLRNIYGNTASQVAALAGHVECAHYLEQATQMQIQANSVYDEMRTPITHPNTGRVSPISNPLTADRISPTKQTPTTQNGYNVLISVNRYHSNPHVAGGAVSPHVAGGAVINNNNNNSCGPSEDCDMDMEEEGGDDDSGAIWMKAVASEDTAISPATPAEPPMGRKRCLDEVENESYKRARSEEPSPIGQVRLNGWLRNNGHMTNKLTSHLTPMTNSVVEHYKCLSMQQGYDNMLLDSA